MTTHRWKFTDLTDSSSAVFITNPDSGGSPTLAKTFTPFPTVVAGGNVILFEGANKPTVIDFSGFLDDQSQLSMFETWANKLHQVQLTDDLGRNYMVVITSFTPQRIWRGRRFWRHTYSVKATIIDWP